MGGLGTSYRSELTALDEMSKAALQPSRKRFKSREEERTAIGTLDGAAAEPALLGPGPSEELLLEESCRQK